MKELNDYVKATLDRLQLNEGPSQKWCHLAGLQISTIINGRRDVNCEKSFSNKWKIKFRPNEQLQKLPN